MIRKIGSILLGLSVIGIVSIGVNSSFTYQASHADFLHHKGLTLFNPLTQVKTITQQQLKRHFKNERPSI